MSPAELISLRERAGKTQEQLAAELSVSSRSVRRWENGETPINARTEAALRLRLGDYTLQTSATPTRSRTIKSKSGN